MPSLVKSLPIMLFCLLFVQRNAMPTYTGYGHYLADTAIAPIFIDDNGRISIGERIEVERKTFGTLRASPRGTHMIDVSNVFRNLKIDKRGAVCRNERIDLEGYTAANAAISPDGRYALLKNVVATDVVDMHVYRIQDNDSLTPTGNSLDLSAEGIAAWDFTISRIKNIIIASGLRGGTANSNYMICLIRLSANGRLIDTGQRISLEPLYAYRLTMSPDGRLCANQALDYIAFLRINEDGNVSYNGEQMEFQGTACTKPVFTGDGKFMLVGEDIGPSLPGLHSFRILPGGGFEKVAALSGFDHIPEVALTPDEKYCFVKHVCIGLGAAYQTVSAVRVYPDGTLKNMLTDVTLPGCFASVVFPPPWLLAEYGVEGDELADFSEWSAGGAPGSFQLPAMNLGSSGMPEMRAASPGACFGFWQCPEDACMIVPRSLYRARFVLSTKQEGGVKKALRSNDDRLGSASSTSLPTLRMRIGTQNQHEAATLSLNAQPEGWLAPIPEGKAYEVLIEPPFSLLRQEENLDDLFLALDLLGFAPDVDTATTIVLQKAWMDRIPIDALSTEALVSDYSFDSGPEGWTSGGARELLSEPLARWTKGALVLEATSNTDCFGFWQNPAADIVTSTGKELYRATCEVKRTEVTDIAHVPVFRMRLNSDDGKLAAVLTVGGTPCEEEAEWEALKPYSLYYLKPETPEPLHFRLAFDLLNYDPHASANATLELHHVTVERLQLPCFPMDR